MIKKFNLQFAIEVILLLIVFTSFLTISQKSNPGILQLLFLTISTFYFFPCKIIISDKLTEINIFLVISSSFLISLIIVLKLISYYIEPIQFIKICLLLAIILNKVNIFYFIYRKMNRYLVLHLLTEIIYFI